MQEKIKDDTISRQAAIDMIIEDKICDESLKIMIALGDGDKAETLNMACDRHAEMLIGLPSAQPDNRLSKIAELVEGTIDHFDLDDAMDLLYQIKEVVGNETSNI